MNAPESQKADTIPADRVIPSHLGRSIGKAGHYGNHGVKMFLTTMQPH